MLKRTILLVSAALLAAACGSGGSEPGGGSTSAEQTAAFARLQDSTQRTWTWVQHDTLGTPAHLSAERIGTPLLRQGDDVGARTLAFLEENKALFRMQVPAVEMSLTKAHVDHLGMTHARFQQVTQGIPVAGHEVYAHYDPAGRIASIDADYVPGLDGLDVVPVLRAPDALSGAKAQILATAQGRDRSGAVLPESSLRADGGSLVVYAPAGAATAKLAYRYRIRTLAAAEPAIWVTMVDAKTGAILHRYNDLQTVDGAGLGVLGEKETFQVSADTTAGFVMSDRSNGVEIATFTADTVQTTPGTELTSTSATSWDTDVIGAGAAVNAHVNAENVFKYYKNHHARNAIDGAGSPMLSTVHFGDAYENAAWDGDGMLYGDGAQTFRPLSLALDVVGHEFTHGVTSATSNLQYQTQSGALNEAVSDIFGAFIEHATAPDPTKNWTIAEAIVKTGGPLRNMMSPGSVSDPQPAHLSQFVNTQEDNGGVHINSGIINNAAWLMTVGGTNPVSNVQVPYGIGWDKSEKVWYRADTVYFKQTTDFGQAAQGVLQSGKDVGLTDNELAIVECAFKATGVAQGACATTITDPNAKPASTTATASPGDPDADKGTPAANTPSDSSDKTAAAPTTRKKAVQVTEGGCSTGGRASGRADLWPFAGLLVVLAGLRRRSRVSRTRP
jgi:Zn-dependent metalloprotease